MFVVCISIVGVIVVGLLLTVGCIVVGIDVDGGIVVVVVVFAQSVTTLILLLLLSHDLISYVI